MRIRPALWLLAGLVAGCGGGAPGEFAGKTTQCLRLLGGVDLQQADVPALQAALDAGRFSSEELTAAYLARIEAFDLAGPALNAVRALAPDALAQARACDAERARGVRRGPLHCLPVMLKDNINTTDMPTTAGAISLADNIPKIDATITARLRAAGAIILGKTNLSEFANWVDLRMPNGYSSLGGQVIAPYDFTADPLGSSTGSGVAAAMAFTTLAIGTETSGSIISPASVHSLAAVKPTLGLVSRSGIIPLAPSFDTAGPMTRHVADAAVLLTAMAGVDPADPASERFRDSALGGEVPDYLAALSTSALEGARLGVKAGESDPGGLFGAARQALIAEGAEIIVIEEPLPTASNVSLLELAAIPNEFKHHLNGYLAEQAGDEVPVETLTEIVLYNEQHPEAYPHGQSLLIASAAQSGLALDPVAVAAREGAVRGSQLWIDTVMDQLGLDAIIAPDFSTVNLAAAAGYPNVTVPMGYAGQDPHGLSFIGRAFTEARLLALAYDYEQASRLRRPPVEINPELARSCPN